MDDQGGWGKTDLPCDSECAIRVPYVRNDGKPGEDIMVCDHICGNPDYVKQLQELMESQAELDLTISFSLREYNGREYTNIKLINLSRRIN